MHTELPAPRPDAHNGVQLRPNFAGNSKKMNTQLLLQQTPAKTSRTQNPTKTEQSLVGGLRVPVVLLDALVSLWESF